MSGVILVVSVFFGFIVALLTVSVTMTNISSRFYNFGCTIPVGVGMLAVFLLHELIGVPLLAAFPFGAITGGLFNVGIYLAVIKQVIKKGKSHVLTSLASLGLILVSTNGLTVLGYYINLRLPSELWCQKGISETVFTANHFHFRVNLLGLDRSNLLILLMIIVVVILIGVWKTGFEEFYRNRLLALKDDPQLLRTQGVDVNQVQVKTWFASGCLSGLAGCLLPVIFKGYPGLSIENHLIIVALSSLLAGLNSFSWALVIGFFLGFNEIFTTAFLQLLFGAVMGEYRALYTVIFWLILVIFFRWLGLWDEPDFDYL